MKSIFEGEVLEALAVPGGLVFAYISEVTRDGKTVVAYRHINFENGRTTTVTKKIFQLAKFGPNYQSLEKNVAHHLSTQAAALEGGLIFLSERDGSAKIINSESDVVWTGRLCYKQEAPSAIAVDGTAVWAAFRDSNAIVRFNISTAREELRIGGGGGENNFNAPCGLFIKSPSMWVSNEGSHKIWLVNVKTYEVDEYMNFEEPVYSYMQTAGLELAVLKSGLYVL